MSDTNCAPEEPIFRALLTPHRSLGRQGFVIMMGTLTAAWLISGAFLLAHGAWPIFGFLGVDILAIYIAFRMNYRAARVREEVSVSRTRLDIRKVAANGRSEDHRFNPFWARFRVARHEMIGITQMAVEARGRSVPVGMFLNPDDRESFSRAFAQALHKARS